MKKRSACCLSLSVACSLGPLFFFSSLSLCYDTPILDPYVDSNFSPSFLLTFLFLLYLRLAFRSVCWVCWWYTISRVAVAADMNWDRPAHRFVSPIFSCLNVICIYWSGLDSSPRAILKICPLFLFALIFLFSPCYPPF